MFSHNEDLKITPSNTQHDIYTTPIKDGAFLFHRSFLLTYQQLEEEQARDYINAILAYAFYGAKLDRSNPVWKYGLDTIFQIIDTDLGRESL